MVKRGNTLVPTFFARVFVVIVDKVVLVVLSLNLFLGVRPALFCNVGTFRLMHRPDY
jgi:hypothetical protein